MAREAASLVNTANTQSASTCLNITCEREGGGEGGLGRVGEKGLQSGRGDVRVRVVYIDQGL